MVNILQSLMSMTLYQIPQLVINFQHKAKINVWIISINGEETITSQGALNEINHHQNLR